MENYNQAQRSQKITEILSEKSSYINDGLASIHNSEFMADKKFASAYARGVEAAGKDYNWQWRIHLGLWAADVASKLDGDFVECGVNAGFMSSSIMHYLDWNILDKEYFLLDTFQGLDAKYVTEMEIKEGILEKNKLLMESGFYRADINSVIRNFAEWKNVNIIKGSIPETLPQVTSDQIAFLHIDLNCAPPEVAAVEFFWEKMVSGAVILLDDYAYWGYRQQKLAMDAAMCRLGAAIASLPTGQGLIIKN